MKNFPWRFVTVGGVLLATGLVLDGICSRSDRRHKDSMLDEALDETFPASDAMATQDFSAPEDRARANA